jgi:threonine/homoserine/homoserine lactone efflux protein
MESFLPLLSYAFVASITPGPNNLMLSASGIAFGWRRTLPHLLGVPVGFGTLLLVCGYGVGAIIERNPKAGLALQIVGSVYLLYLAWAMRYALAPTATGTRARPIGFGEAVLFQFANPKGWIMALTTASVFVPAFGDGAAAVWLVVALVVAVNVPCITSWVLLGVSARRYLGDPRWRRASSIVLVVLMLYTVVAIWIPS